jgi:two-component system CheB/CheR fusion protein
MRNHGLEATRILLVEDAKDVRDVFSMLLQAEGAEVTATGSGLEAAAIANREEFDLLLTDLGLPDIPGDVVIRQVLDRAKHRPRVVVVTGYDEPFVSRARQAGADVVLTKPVAWNVLLDYLAPSRQRTLAA